MGRGALWIASGLLAGLAGCAQGGTRGSPRDAGLDAASTRLDSGGTDARVLDAPSSDAPSPLDADPPLADAGPARIDAGPAPVDAGPAPVDAGPAPVDAGPAPVDAGGAITATWSTTATDHDCATPGVVGSRFSYTCPAGGPAGSAWGTDLYTHDSSICTAAAHVGTITVAAGGTVTIEMRAGAASYTASTRNGITTSSWGAWTCSFAVP